MRRIALTLLFASLLFFPRISACESPTVYELSALFYGNFDHVSDRPLEDRIAFLQNFIQDHPEFYHAYYLLYEQFVLADDLSQAKRVFHKLARNKAARLPALWMLAKIYELAEKPNKADHFYRQAIHAGELPLQAAMDYLTFDQNNSMKYNALSVLHSPKQSPGFDYFCSAYFSYKKGDYQSADSLCRLVMLDDAPELLHLRGSNLTFLNRNSEADSLFKLGLQQAVDKEDLRFQAIFLTDCFYTAPATEDEKLIKQAHETAVAVHDKMLLNSVLKYEAYLERENGQNEAAANLFKEAAIIADKFKQINEAAELNYQVAESYYRMNKLSAALAAAENCADYSRRFDDAYHLAASYEMLGKIYDSFRQLEMAKHYYQLALSLAIEYKDTGCADRMNEYLTDVDMQTADDVEAINYYRENIARYESRHKEAETVRQLTTLGRLYLAHNDLDSALDVCQKAYERAQRFRLAYQQSMALGSLADIYLTMNNIGRAMPLVQQVLALSNKQHLPRLSILMYLSLGNYYQRKLNYQQAIDYYAKAVDIIETLRKDAVAEELRSEFLSYGRFRIYDALCECHYRLFKESHDRGHLEEIYRLMELTHARTLKDHRVYPTRKRHISSAAGDEYSAACRTLRVKQNELREYSRTSRNKPIDSLVNEIEFDKQLVISSRIKAVQQQGDAEASEEAEIPDLAKLQATLPDISVLMYQVTENAAFVMVVDADTVAIIDLPTRKSLMEAEIDSLISPLHHVESGTLMNTPYYAGSAHRLYQQLFEPVERQINLKPAVCIVACYTLANLPFDLLLTNAPAKAAYFPTEEPDYADYFLTNRYSLCYSPSVIFLSAKQQTIRKGDMLIVANPCSEKFTENQPEVTMRLRTGWRLDPLLFAEAEAKGIKRIYNRARIYTHEKASEQRIKRSISDQAIVHFASHAYVDTTSDAFSGLVLASEKNDDDGIFMGFEIGDLQMNCDLVTLSACETGRGKRIHGEGVMGLPRQFLAAGAATVIMSHWKVDDQFTSLFMPLFYENLLQKGESKTRALQQAKQEILNRRQPVGGLYYQHPFFWAAFSLYGQPGIESTPEALHKSHRGLYIFIILSAAMLLFFSLIILRRKNSHSPLI
jgi:CHAT domain-containing protein